MKFAVIQVSNGNFKIVSEWTDNLQGAKLSYHDTCKVLLNSPDVIVATVSILDEQLNIVEGYKETITHVVTDG